MAKGHVYILTNEAMPGLLKIGMTTGSPELRAAQLSSTGVPYPFILQFYVSSPNCGELEAWVHDALSEYRVSSGKEFFEIDIAMAIRQLTASHVEQLSLWLDEFGEQYTLVEQEAFVDSGDLYFLADQCDDEVMLICQAIGELTPDEIRPAIDRVKRRHEKTKRPFFQTDKIQ